MEHQIRIGDEIATFDVLPDVVAARHSDKDRFVEARAIGKLVSLRNGISESNDLSAFVKAGWAIGAPAHDEVREVATRAARLDSVELREVLFSDDGRYYIDSGRVVASVKARSLQHAIDLLDKDGFSIVTQLPLGTTQFAESGGFLLLARVVGDRSTLRTVSDLQATGRYHYLEPDLIEHIDTRMRPNAPDYYLQWHWDNTGSAGGVVGADIGAEKAWDRTRGHGTRIAIIDNGFELDHPSLRDAVGWGGYFVDTVNDAHFMLRTTGSYPASGHGTACAGMAVARCDSRQGGCGIAHEAEFMPIACLKDQVGTQLTLARALTFAALPERSRFGNGIPGADVISCSLGPNVANWRKWRVLSDAIETVVTEGRGGLGTVLVWAASNADVPIAGDKVASDHRVLAVGRSTRMDRHHYSAYGESLGLVAPGVDVYTTVSGARWDFETGCSFAAPVVAGVAGLILAREPKFTRTQVVDRLLSTCRKIGGGSGGYDLRGRSPRYGHGRVDANAAVP